MKCRDPKGLEDLQHLEVDERVRAATGAGVARVQQLKLSGLAGLATMTWPGPGLDYWSDDDVAVEKWREIERPFHARDKIAEDHSYPVRLEKILQPSHADPESPLQEGDILWLSAHFFEKTVR